MRINEIKREKQAKKVCKTQLKYSEMNKINLIAALIISKKYSAFISAKKDREEKAKELSVLTKKLTSVQDAILTASSNQPNAEQAHAGDSSGSELHDSLGEQDYWADVSNTSPKTTSSTPTGHLQHPHFEGKRPKQHQPPRCISVICKEEKQEKDDKIIQLTEEVKKVKEELSEFIHLIV